MAEDFITTLFEAHDEIKKLIKKGHPDTAMDLMGQCQDGIIKVGNLIEESEGEDFVTVGLIEEYCQQLFNIYEEVLHQTQEGKAAAFDKPYKMLNKKLIQIQNSVKNDIQVRLEVVFLPYKASMWDSLESVWNAADDDEACDAYVIPIPYYDRKPDGSFGRMHYEGELYPDYVPMTNYEAYDFESRRPDMIYIHNPYDDMNLVTSVHPFFYSKNLKNFTDKLVYIPYFILAEPTAFDEKSLEGMSHYATTPAVINADKVIVQSEAMKRAYVETLARVMGEETRSIWEEKILGLGSPKLDKVARTDRDALEIPEHWQRIITKPDGSPKKIIFYNTSVGALLENDADMLAKMRNVLDAFRENADEVALLWRPHPLIRATIESMRPQLWEEYESIVNQYREEGWGIYDDTPELDRAVALCDGYYGDPSSVVQLCQEAGRPVMVQSVGV